MVQPKYSPEEALERVKLMMKYDTSKTLNENKKVILEQSTGDLNPAVVGSGIAGAGIGALAGAGVGAQVLGGTAAAVLAGSTAGSTVFPIVGTAIGAVAGLGLAMLADWAVNHDLGQSGFEQVMSACKAAGVNRLVPKLSKAEVRQIAYTIQDAKGTWNDDEDSIVAALTEIPTVADLCAVDKKIPGGLVQFLDDLTNSPDEWKMFTRPLEGMVEDTEVILTPEEQKQANVDGGADSGGSTTSGYKSCSGTYSYGCKSDAIKTVQGCLSLVTDGKFGPKTQAALKAKGFDSFTDADVNKICNKTTTVDSDEEDVDPEDPNQI
jgi:hypothetical protein